MLSGMKCARFINARHHVLRWLANVLQVSTRPVFSPRFSHSARCACRAVCERVGHHAPARGLLQLVIADGLRRADRALDVAGLQNLCPLVGVEAQTPARQSAINSTRTDRLFASALLPAACCALLHARQDAEQILDVMSDLVRDHISVGEFAAAAEIALHLTEERRVEIHLLVARAIESGPMADCAVPQAELVTRR